MSVSSVDIKTSIKAFATLFLAAVATHAQTASSAPLSERALQEFREGKYGSAEHDFREITKSDPSNIYAQVYLGQTLFKEEKYTDAVDPFERARTLEKRGTVLSSDQHRILTDQLVMAYGIGGQLKKAHDLLDDAIAQDPEYPLNYYNLACALAEEGNKDKMLANLARAFQHKDHVLKGEQMPDPRSDSSFQKYVQDDDFVKLMKALGFK
jgi:predicted Zn-dependent protease